MEGILIMLLYLVAGFFKNRSDKKKRKEIESDPDWETTKGSRENFKFDKFFTNIIDDNYFDDQKKSEETLHIYNESESLEKINVNKKSKEENNSEKILEVISNKNILKEKVKIPDIKKINKKELIRKNFLFKNTTELKRAIIYKEILDKPLSLRKS